MLPGTLNDITGREQCRTRRTDRLCSPRGLPRTATKGTRTRAICELRQRDVSREWPQKAQKEPSDRQYSNARDSFCDFCAFCGEPAFLTGSHRVLKEAVGQAICKMQDFEPVSRRRVAAALRGNSDRGKGRECGRDARAPWVPRVHRCCCRIFALLGGWGSGGGTGGGSLGQVEPLDDVGGDVYRVVIEQNLAVLAG